MIDKFNPTLPEGTDPATAKPGIIPAAAEQRLKNDAGAALETAKTEFAHLRDEAASQAGMIADEAKTEISKLADKAKGMASEQKNLVAEQLGGVAEAVQRVAGELEMNDSTTAGYARTIADTVTRFSDTVKNKDVDELLSVAEDFGRKQPVAFMGAAALLGFAASRFLFASAKRRQPASSGMSGQYGERDDVSGSYGSSGTYGSTGNYGSSSNFGSSSTSGSGMQSGSSNTNRSSGSATLDDAMGETYDPR